MKKLKVLTVIGTRPEIIRLSLVIKKLDDSPAIEHILVHTGQNFDYELNEVFFEDLSIRRPDYFLDSAGKNSNETIAKVLLNISPILEKIAPDAFLVLGDTNSALCAIPAKKLHIPIFHMEAGNRCFDQRVPEEVNRKIIDHISDINLTYSSLARECLIKEGLLSDRIIKTGSPMFEVLQNYMPKINQSTILQKLKLTPFNYFVMSAHREENISSERNFNNLINTLNTIVEKYKLPIIVSTHPRTRMKIEEKKINIHPMISLHKPLALSDYISLQINAKVTLSDSGTISEESSILNFPALNIRETHERLEAMEEASVMMVGLNTERIIQGIEQLQYQKTNGEERAFKIVEDYTKLNVSDKIVRIIISYTDYVKRIVWGE